jgi:hypothetical protein
MEGEQPTRWEAARAEWRGLRWGREGKLGVAGGLVAGLVLLVLGFPGAALVDVIVVLASAITAAILVPLSELAWAWHEAPMRMLNANVGAIRTLLETQGSQSGSSAPQLPALQAISIRLGLMDLARKGDEILGYQAIPTKYFTDWANEVVKFMTVYATRDHTEEILLIPGNGRAQLAERVARLRALALSYD